MLVRTVNLSVVTSAKDERELSLAKSMPRRWASLGVVAAIVGVAAAILIGIDPSHLLPQAHTSLSFLKPGAAILSGLIGGAIVSVCYMKYRHHVGRKREKITHYSECVRLGKQIRAAEGAQKKAFTLQYLQQKQRFHTKPASNKDDFLKQSGSSSHNFPVYAELARYLEPIPCPEYIIQDTIECDLFDGLCSGATFYAAKQFCENGDLEQLATLFEKGIPFEAAPPQIFSSH